MSEPDRPCGDCGAQMERTRPLRFECSACDRVCEFQVQEFTAFDGTRIVTAGDGVVTTDDLMQLELHIAAVVDELGRESN